ncbi:MAG: DUF2283 domain-containing protein [Candidatus Omnitrophica bacterium]|nr:DUF2283 domain-containing protein [Candidatus Omnitrophota bacterium]
MKNKKINGKNKKIISFSVDTLARAVYIQYASRAVSYTEKLDSSVNIDYDKDNNIIGIEILGVKIGQTTFNQLVRDTKSVFKKSVCKDLDPYLQPI